MSRNLRRLLKPFLMLLAFLAAAPLAAGEAERLWSGGKDFGAFPPLGSAGPLVLQAPAAGPGEDERVPPPMVQPGKPPSSLQAGPPSGTRPLGKLDLSALHNRLWRTSLTVPIGGRTFHVSGMQSHEGHYFIVIHDPEGKTYFFRETTLGLGGAEIRLNGSRTRVWISLNPLDLYGSELKFQEGGKLLKAFPVRDIMRAMYEAGEPVSWAGREFRVHYSDQAFEDSSGKVARVGEPLLVLMREQAKYRSEKYRYIGDAIETGQIPGHPGSDRVLVGYFKFPQHGTFSHAFRKVEGGRVLEVF